MFLPIGGARSPGVARALAGTFLSAYPEPVFVAQPSWLPVLRATLPAERSGGKDAVQTSGLEACATCCGRFRIPMHGQRPGPCSGLAAEAHIVVEVQQVEPAEDVLARLAELCEQLVEKLASLDIVRPAGILVSGPGGDFPRPGLGLGTSMKPFQDFAIPFALG